MSRRYAQGKDVTHLASMAKLKGGYVRAAMTPDLTISGYVNEFVTLQAPGS